MNLEDINGYTLNNLNKINIVLGKNGCGKSTVLKKVQEVLEKRQGFGNTKYISPERGGSLKYNSTVEQSTSNNPKWLPAQLRKNQFTQFKEHTVLQFRKLELLSLREIEKDKNLRNDHGYTFEKIVGEINLLLDYIEIRREGADFSIYNKLSNSSIEPDVISSGESELISLGIECLVFAKESSKSVNNILFLDEPDAHLHPDLQMRLALFLKRLVEENNFRVIVATHSTSFLAAFEEYYHVSIEFLRAGQTVVNFRSVSDIYRKILPIFGAHPLSNLFNEAPIFLVEGEDDERIWQQAVRTSRGGIKIFPCSVESVDRLSEYESQVATIIGSIYDSARAYSLRDRDSGCEEIDDLPPVTRLRLSCRAAENLLLSDEVLTRLNINWETLKLRIDTWIKKNTEHSHYLEMKKFQDEGYDRKSYNLKEIRNDLMGIIESNKPWETVVGQTIASTKYIVNPSCNSIQSYLGEKLVRSILKADGCQVIAN